MVTTASLERRFPPVPEMSASHLGSDVRAWRADTPATESLNHLNNAGAGLMPHPVLEAVGSHLALESRIGGYEAADAVEGELAAVYSGVAELIGSQSHNIALLEHATVAFNAALSSIAFQEGDVLLTTRNDYVSNQIAFLSLQNRFGVEVVRAPDAEAGGFDVGAMEALIRRRRPKLVSVTHVPTSSGLVQPVEAIGALCASLEVLYLVDACQSVGQMPLDVDRIQCDFLSATGRKFLRGPRGTGFLYVSDGVLSRGLEPLFPDLHGAVWVDDDIYQAAPDATRFEMWESSIALRLGLGQAARYATRVGLSESYARVQSLAERLRAGLAELPEARVLDHGEHLCGIVTVAIDGMPSGPLSLAMRARGVNTSYIEESSAVLDYRDKGVTDALRLSPHYYNTEDEIDAAVALIAELIERGL